jgi:hypothetical protein
MLLDCRGQPGRSAPPPSAPAPQPHRPVTLACRPTTHHHWPATPSSAGAQVRAGGAGLQPRAGGARGGPRQGAAAARHRPPDAAHKYEEGIKDYRLVLVGSTAPAAFVARLARHIGRVAGRTTRRSSRRRHRRPPPPHLRSQVQLDDTIHSLSTVTPEGVPQQGRALLVSLEGPRSADSRPSSMYSNSNQTQSSSSGRGSSSAATSAPALSCWN